jgi:hypothetical protein
MCHTPHMGASSLRSATHHTRALARYVVPHTTKGANVQSRVKIHESSKITKEKRRLLL